MLISTILSVVLLLGITGYIKYKEDASTLAVPFDNPIYEYTDKTLELKKFF